MIRSLLLLTLIVWLAGCEVAQLRLLHLIPSERVRLLQGESSTLTVYPDGVPECKGSFCQQLDGLVYDYRILGLPGGLSYQVDTTLQSAATPGTVQIELSASDTVAPGPHTGLLQASVNSVVIGKAVIDVLVVALTPTRAPRIVDIGAGGHSSFSFAAEGAASRVYTWGSVAARRADVRQSKFETLSRSLPSLGFVPDNIRQLSAGFSHKLAIAADGSLLSWGNNGNGELGDGTTEQNVVPSRRAAPTGARAIAAGPEYSLALTDAGAVWSWGRNVSRQLARDSEEYFSADPTPIAALNNVKAIATGRFHGITLLNDGTLRAWGGGSNLQVPLGNGSPAMIDAVPPVVVSGLSNVTAISLSNLHSLALADDGRVWAWGNNSNGQLGDGTTDTPLVPVRAIGLRDVTAVAASSVHSLALSNDGRVWLWGADVSGVVGDIPSGGPFLPITEPTRVEGLSGIVAIAAGSRHSLALEDCGRVWSWGNNHQGSLGIGSFGERDGEGQLNVVLGLEGITCNRALLKISRAGVGAVLIEDAVGARCVDQDAAIICITEPGALNPRVELRATATSSSQFTGWAQDCSGNGAALTVALDGDKNCLVRFAAAGAQPLLLRVATNGGGRVSSNGAAPDSQLGPTQIDCGDVCAAVFRSGDTVTLSASPAPDSLFTGWSGDCSGQVPTTTLTISDHRFCRANFQTRQFRLAVTTDGQGTVRTVGTGAIDCPGVCSADLEPGTVRLTATPAAGWQFERWRGDCNGTDATTDVTLEGDSSCSAEFALISNGYTFTVGVANDGPGRVVSDPPGIDCRGPQPCQNVFPADSNVTLQAIPDPGFQVRTWSSNTSADCSGSTDAVTVRADRDVNCQVFLTKRIERPYLVAAIDAPATAQTGTRVEFESESYMLDPNTGQRNSNVALSWDFEDDGIVEIRDWALAKVYHVFPRPGNYRVRLTVKSILQNPPLDPVSATATVTIAGTSPELRFLTVRKSGAGAAGGSVAIAQIAPPSSDYFLYYHCAADCGGVISTQLPLGATISLQLFIQDNRVTFGGWEGDCSQFETSPQFTLDSNKNCTARFDRIGN